MTNINITKFLNASNINDLAVAIAEPTYKYEYILLDTNVKDTTLSSVKKPVWSLTTSSKKSIGLINLNPRIHTIHSIRLASVYAAFIRGDQDPNIAYVNTLYNTDQNLTVLFDEFATQSYIAKDTRKFHFLLDRKFIPQGTGRPNTTSTYYEYSVVGNNYGWYDFDHGFQIPNTLSISFANPNDLVTISQSNSNIVEPSYVIGLQIKYLEDTAVDF